MLSRLLGVSRLGVSAIPRTLDKSLIQQNLIFKRSSGHNNMRITPSNFTAYKLKDMLLFHSVIVGIPIAVLATIINIRANPELAEIPEGYEPRHWEYYRHPVTRFISRYFFYPADTDYEMLMCMENEKGENLILKKLHRKVDKVMAFYNDHRSHYFVPFFGDYVRRSREDGNHAEEVLGQGNETYDGAYDASVRVVPAEGYHIRLEP